MSLQQRLFYGIISGAGSVVLKALLNILLVPVLIYHLGIDIYGLYVLLIGLLEISSVMDLGFTATLVTVLGASGASDGAKRTAQLLAVGHWLYVGLSILTLVIGAVLIPWFPMIFHIPQALIEPAQVALWIILAECVLMLYTLYFRAILMAHCLNQWVNVSDTLFILIANLLGLLLMINGFGLAALLLARLGAAFLRLILLAAVTLRVEPDALFPKARLSFSVVKEMMALGLHSFLVNLSVVVSHKVDTFVIALFLPLRMVGYYEIVFRFLGIALQTASKISECVFPMFARMVALRKEREMRHLFLRISSFSNYTVGVMLISILSFYPELFQLFSAGKIPIETTLPVLALAVPCIWSGVLQMPAGYYLFVSGKQKYLSVSSLVAAASNLLLSLILVQQLGLVGVALGTLIPQLLQHQAFLIAKTCRELRISWRDYLCAVHLAPIWPLVGVYLWIQLLRPLLEQNEVALAPLGLVALSVLIVGGALWVLLLATSEEKSFLAERLSAWLKGRKASTATGGANG